MDCRDKKLSEANAISFAGNTDDWVGYEIVGYDWVENEITRAEHRDGK